jgi:hypothetical protein
MIKLTTIHGLPNRQAALAAAIAIAAAAATG